MLEKGHPWTVAFWGLLALNPTITTCFAVRASLVSSRSVVTMMLNSRGQWSCNTEGCAESRVELEATPECPGLWQH